MAFVLKRFRRIDFTHLRMICIVSCFQNARLIRWVVREKKVTVIVSFVLRNLYKMFTDNQAKFVISCQSSSSKLLIKWKENYKTCITIRCCNNLFSWSWFCNRAFQSSSAKFSIFDLESLLLWLEPNQIAKYFLIKVWRLLEDKISHMLTIKLSCTTSGKEHLWKLYQHSYAKSHFKCSVLQWLTCTN